MPVIDGVQVVDDGEQTEQDAHTEGQNSGRNEAVPPMEELNEKENEQVLIALAEVDRWIEQKDYKLSIGATTKNVRALMMPEIILTIISLTPSTGLPREFQSMPCGRFGIQGTNTL